MKKKNCWGKQLNCFLTKDEAVIHFTKASEIALKKYEKATTVINKLKEELEDFYFDCNVKVLDLKKYKKITTLINKLEEELGDFYFDCNVKVLDDEKLETTTYIEFCVKGYTFKFNQ